MKAGLNREAVVALAALAATVTPLGACANQRGTEPNTSPYTEAPPGAEKLSTQLKSADGTTVANATFEFANGYATLTLEAGPNQILTPGFHGLHVHSVGKCEANSVAPTGGEAGNFNSAGGHFQAPGHASYPASGDLTSLEVRPDGSAKLVTTTNSFSAADLKNSSGTALIIHQDPDNFGNIPTARYTQKNGAAGPDEQTLATGDSGKRVACGVIAPATATTTSSTTATTTATTVTTTTAAPASPSTSTSTSTVTITSSPMVTTTPSKTATTNSLPPGG